MQMLGGNGYTNGKPPPLPSPPLTLKLITDHPPDYPVNRFWRDARLYTVGAGTQEIRRMLIGRTFNEELA